VVWELDTGAASLWGAMSEPHQHGARGRRPGRRRRGYGPLIADHTIGPELFRQACLMGLEGLVSKRLDRPYRARVSKDWVKVKNRTHPAMQRVMKALK
jgi:hypothetical protein